MSIDPYSDPWPNDNQALIEAFNVCMSNITDPEDRAFEASEWALGAIVNRRDSVFVHVITYCFPDKLTDVFVEACREKYIFAAMHLADQCAHNVVKPIHFAAQTGSFELLEKVLGDTEITEDVADQILMGALKGDGLNIVKHYHPNGFSAQNSAFVRFAARYNAIECLQHFVTEPLTAQDWEHCIEYALKDYGAKTIEFLFNNPPSNPEKTVPVAEYALNIAQRLIDLGTTRRNVKMLDCLRLCMHRVVWDDFEAQSRHLAGFQKYSGELFEMYQEPRIKQFKEHLHNQIGTVSELKNTRKM